MDRFEEWVVSAAREMADKEGLAEKFGVAGDVKKLSVYVPVSAQQMLDAGLPLPPGVEPPAAMPRLAWHKRVRWAFADWRFRTRERVGFWIAGYTPD